MYLFMYILVGRSVSTSGGRVCVDDADDADAADAADERAANC